MGDRDFCMEHSGHAVRLNSLEKSDEESWRAIDRAHERIDGMKNWVIAGMASLVLQLVVIIGALVLVYMKLGG